jgi:hypothetical protein
LTVLARLSNERADVDEVIVAGLSKQFSNCAAELVAVSTETASRLPELAALAFDRLPSPLKRQVASLLGEWLPVESVQLAGLICVVFSHLSERANERLKQNAGRVDLMLDYAWKLDRYAAALFQTGRYEAAHDASHRALITIQKLFSRDRAQYEGTYSRYLFNYSTYLSHLGKDDEALKCDREALEIRERLVKKDPDRIEPVYALSLDHYAAELSIVGRYQEARENSEKAVEIIQRLANDNPNRFEIDYARILDNYAYLLDDAGKTKDALVNSHKALKIYEQLVLKNPDRFEPDQAESLRNHASYLTNVGHLDEAIRYALEADAIFQRLAEKQRERFGADFLLNVHLLRLARWLCDESFINDKDSPGVMFPSHPYPTQSLIRLYVAFVEGCITNEREIRADRFRFVITSQCNLSERSKQHIKTCRLCAAAWCAKFDATTDANWEADWQTYLTNRDGNIPFWMAEVARRLDFQFPELIKSDSSVDSESCRNARTGSMRAALEAG